MILCHDQSDRPNCYEEDSLTSRSTFPAKFLVLDGIGGIPLGNEICMNLQELGYSATHFNCLKQQTRTFYDVRSAYAKVINKQADKDEFYLLPKLTRQTLENIVRKECPTHILVIGFIYKFFDPEELRRIATRHGATLLLYDTDSCNLYGKRREFIFFIEKELPVYDRIFSFSKVTTRFFKETRGLPATYLPYGAQPISITNKSSNQIDALFVGSGDLRRILLLETIKENITIHGNRWERNFPLISSKLRERITDKAVWGNDLHALLSSAKIVLNITRTDFFGAETGVNLRIFEALAAGCFLLTDHCEEIAELFIVGHEIETYRSSGELAEKVAYYLNNDDKRLEIAHNGHQIFLSKHTWKARIEKNMLPLLDQA